MPSEITDITLVERLAVRRQQVEAQFAKAVYKVFNTGTALRKLQTFAQLLIKQMTMKGDPEMVRTAIAKEPHLGVWKKIEKNVPSLAAFAGNVFNLARLDATDCADVIRLAGTFVEIGGLHNLTDGIADVGTDWKKVHTEVYRGGRGPAGLVGPAARRKVGVDVAEHVPHAGWSQEPGGGRQRHDRIPMEAHLGQYVRDPKAFSGMASGSKRASAGSWTLFLDQLFGLVVGCDISGTTADTISGMDRAIELSWSWGTPGGGAINQELTSHYYMAPMGTIVANFHHSLLEVALPLCQNQELHYHVGFFETLKPVRSGAFPAELQGVQQAIDVADAQMRGESLHHLRYYGHNGTLQGAFRFDAGELPQLRYSTISDALLMYEYVAGFRAGTKPDRDLVVDVIQQQGGFLLRESARRRLVSLRVM